MFKVTTSLILCDTLCVCTQMCKQCSRRSHKRDRKLRRFKSDSLFLHPPLQQTDQLFAFSHFHLLVKCLTDMLRLQCMLQKEVQNGKFYKLKVFGSECLGLNLIMGFTVPLTIIIIITTWSLPHSGDIQIGAVALILIPP